MCRPLPVVACLLVTMPFLAAGEIEPPPTTVVLQRLVGTGDPAPDGNGTFGFPLFPPIVDAQGTVAFTAFLHGTAAGNFDDEAVLVVPDQVPWIAVREGAPAPAGGGLIGSPFPGVVPPFWWPSMNGNGQLAVSTGFILAGLFDDVGVLRVDVSAAGMTAPELVVRTGEALPGGTVCGGLLGDLVPIDRAGRVAVLLREFDGMGETRGVWVAAPGQLQSGLREGDAAPGGGVVDALPLGKLTLDAQGRVGFVAKVEAAGAVGDASVSGAPGALSAGLLEGMSLGGGVRLGSFQEFPVTNARGDAAVLAWLRSDQPPFSLVGSGLVLVRDGVPALLAATGDPSPDGRGTLQGLLLPQISDGGLVAFTAVHAWDEKGFGTDASIVRGDEHGLHVVVRTGDVLPGGQVVGAAVHAAQIAADGLVAVTLGVGSAFPYPNATSLVARRPGGALFEIVTAGHVLGGRRVKFVDLPVVPDVGGHRALNDRGQLALALTFDDGTSAVYRATLLPTPKGETRPKKAPPLASPGPAVTQVVPLQPAG